MLYVTKQIETMTFGKSVIALFSKIEPKTKNVDLLGFIQHLYDTTCLNLDFWVKLVWGLG